MADEGHNSWLRSVLGLDPAKYEPAAGKAAHETGKFLTGVAEGLYSGAKDMVVGLYDLGKAAAKEGAALATDANERTRVGGAIKDGAQAVGDFASEAVHDPGAAATKVGHAAKAVAGATKQIASKLHEDYTKAAAAGNGSEFIGKGVGEAAILIGSFFIPGGGEAKAATLAADAAKAAKAAEAAGDIAKAAKLMELSRAAETARAAEAANAAAKAGKVGKVGKAAEAADAADAGKAGIAAESAEVEEAARATKIASRPHAANPPKDYTQLRKANPTEFDGAQTFKPKGVAEKDVDAFLKSPKGESLLREAQKDPATADRMVARLKAMLMSGAEQEPKIEKCAQPLVKIVPKGNKVGPFSPFFSTPEHLNEAVQSGKNLAEFFGLPASSEAAEYDIYLIVPKGAQDVVVNTVAPTVEFGGGVERGGGAVQHLVLDRKQWSVPKLIGHVGN